MRAASGSPCASGNPPSTRNSRKRFSMNDRSTGVGRKAPGAKACVPMSPKRRVRCAPCQAPAGRSAPIQGRAGSHQETSAPSAARATPGACGNALPAEARAALPRCRPAGSFQNGLTVHVVDYVVETMVPIAVALHGDLVRSVANDEVNAIAPRPDLRLHLIMRGVQLLQDSLDRRQLFLPVSGIHHRSHQ